MKRFHIAIGVADISRSVDDYTRRLGLLAICGGPG